MRLRLVIHVYVRVVVAPLQLRTRLASRLYLSCPSIYTRRELAAHRACIFETSSQVDLDRTVSLYRGHQRSRRDANLQADSVRGLEPVSYQFQARSPCEALVPGVQVHRIRTPDGFRQILCHLGKPD